MKKGFRIHGRMHEPCMHEFMLAPGNPCLRWMEVDSMAVLSYPP